MNERMNSIPKELIVDPKNRDLMITPEIHDSLPGIKELFKDVDKQYLASPHDYLEWMHDSVSSIDYNGQKISYSVLNRSQDAKTALIVFAPFSDGAPTSNVDDLPNFGAKPSFREKKQADTNSWNQLTKSAVNYDLLKAAGHEMPVITIFSSIPQSAYSDIHLKRIKSGDFMPAGRIAEAVLASAEKDLREHGVYVDIEKVHFDGGSLGASNTFGAAEYFAIKEQRQVVSATGREMIIGPKNIADLAYKFLPLGGIVGPASSREHAIAGQRIHEPYQREIDKNGYPVATSLRVINAMSKVAILHGLTQPKNQLATIERLMSAKVDILTAVAENSGISHDTSGYLRRIGAEDIINIGAVGGNKIGHIINEFVATSGLVVAMNIIRAEQKRTNVVQ